MDWLTAVDRFFDYIELPNDKKVKFVTYRLKWEASVWWDKLREMRMREGRGPVQTWRRMKQLLQGRFLPSDYEQYIFYAYQRCTQDSKSVNEYTAEFFRLAKRNQLSESENQLATRYLSGLKQTIRDKIGVDMVFNVQEARNLAMKAELLTMEQTRSTNYRGYGGVDNKAPSDKGITPLNVYETVKTVNVGVEKGKSVAME